MGFTNQDYARQAEILILSSTGSMDEAVELYFSSVHHWFPILHEHRTRESVRTFDAQTFPGDKSVLLLAMHLSNQHPDPENDDFNMETPLYSATKQLVNSLLAALRPSLELLQACVLVAIYEYGHGMPEAADLTVGVCARIGYTLKLHQVPNLTFPDGDDWTAQDDGQRTWWGVLVIDRFVTPFLSIRFLPPAVRHKFR